MNIKNILELANNKLKLNGIENYFYETRELLAFILNKSKEWIMINLDYELSDQEYNKFLILIKVKLSHHF